MIPRLLLVGAILAGLAGSALAADDKGVSKSAFRQWTFDTTLAAFSDSDLRHQKTGPVSGSGVLIGLGLHYQDREKKPGFKLDYEVAQPFYSRAHDLDRLMHRFQAVRIVRLSGKVDLNLIAEANANDFLTLRTMASDYGGEARLDIELDKRDELQAGIGFRNKDYLFSDRTDAKIPFVEIGLKHDLKEGRSLAFNYRREQSSANVKKFDFDRNTYTLDYKMPLGKKDDLALRVRMQEKFYFNQKVKPAGQPKQLRTDHLWKFSAEWDHKLRSRTELQLRYSYFQRQSNDFVRNYGDHQVYAGVKYSF